MKEIFKYISQPCRNFNILAMDSILDPADNREKVILSNFAAASTGSIMLFDIQNRTCESYDLPSDSGAWAVKNLNNEKILVGTCPGYGQIHCFDLNKRDWMEPLRIETETYIWNFAEASDGYIYAGTYPGCRLLRYDPKTHSLKDMGKVSDVSGNLYLRDVRWENSDVLYLTGGFIKPFVSEYDLKTGEIKVIAESLEGDYLTLGDSTEDLIKVCGSEKIDYYDKKTHYKVKTEKNIDKKKKGRGLRYEFDGSKVFVVRGQEYFIYDEKTNPEGIPENLERIPAQAPPTHIHNLVCDENNILWGACGFGQTIFKFDPKTGEYWNSPAVSDNTGEVYGMVFYDKKLYMTAYSSGDHIIYDPEQKWDQVSNINPKTIKTMYPMFIRPLGISVLGDDDNIWTGWSTRYAKYGGGLTKITTRSGEVSYWYDPVPEQQVISLCSKDNNIFFTTNGSGNGLPEKKEKNHFVMFSKQGEIIFDYKFEMDEKAGIVYKDPEKNIMVFTDKYLRIFDTNKMSFTSKTKIHNKINCVVVKQGKCFLFSSKTLYGIEENKKLYPIGALPDDANHACLAMDNNIYFSSGTKLYMLTNI